MRPDTVTEIRREMNVREPTQNVMVWSKKAYNADTCKYDTDSIATIHSYSLSELTDSGDYHAPDPRHIYCSTYRPLEDEPINSPVYNIPKFIPRDNDFDKECEKEKSKDDSSIWLNYIKSEEYKRYVEQRENDLARARVLQRSGELFANTIQNKWVPK